MRHAKNNPTRQTPAKGTRRLGHSPDAVPATELTERLRSEREATR